MDDLAWATDNHAGRIEELGERLRDRRQRRKRFEQRRPRFREEENGRKRKMGKETLASQEGQGQQLLPGIYDEITLMVITPKLPWRALQTLVCVSRVWKQAYESRQVYAARVHSHATDRFDVTEEHLPRFGNRLIVRSMRDDDLRYVLPSIPRVDNGYLSNYSILLLDGRIYAAGTGREHQEFLFAFDLAGQKQWKECASMQKREDEVAVFRFNPCVYVVKDGKLYVSRGIRYFKEAPWGRDGGCEVYDPMVDSWSSAEFLEEWFSKWDEKFVEV